MSNRNAVRSLAAALLLTTAVAAAPAPIAIPTLQGVDDDGYPQRRVSFPNGVVGLQDLIYVRRLHFRPLALDVYLPPKASQHNGKPLPLVVYVHGGAWVTGTPRGKSAVGGYPATLSSLAARGYVVASISYRLDGEAHFPAAINDVKDAIRFLRRNSQRFGIDSDRVGIWGASAGGHLAALAGTSCGVAALEPPVEQTRRNAPTPPEVSDCVQAAVSWFGVHDFVTIPIPPNETGPAPYLGCTTPRCPRETLQFASPATYVDSADPPILLIHGLADKLVAVSQSQEFDQRLRAAKVPVEMVLIPNVDHGFIGKTPDDTKAATLQALAATFDFFDRVLQKSSRTD